MYYYFGLHTGRSHDWIPLWRGKELGIIQSVDIATVKKVQSPKQNTELSHNPYFHTPLYILTGLAVQLYGYQILQVRDLQNTD